MWMEHHAYISKYYLLIFSGLNWTYPKENASAHKCNIHVCIHHVNLIVYSLLCQLIVLYCAVILSLILINCNLMH